MSDCVLCEINGAVANITINRPQSFNALNEDVVGLLYKILEKLNETESIKVVILSGAGTKAFVAGADIAQMKDLDAEQAAKWSEFGQKTMLYMRSMRPTLIAAVNGYALGGGCELALACDIRVACEEAKFGIPEASLGVIPGFGGTQLLPRLIGVGRAVEMLATARQVGADEALGWGLINYKVPQKELMPFCTNLAEKIISNSGNAIFFGKQAMYDGCEMPIKESFAHETRQFAATFKAEDQAEGMKAFMEKRKPVFK